MKKLKSFSLVSDFQCSEEWDKMTPTSKGRFCYSCSKEVIDIRGMSSERIRELASAHSNGFCAQAAPTQFRTYHEPQKENSGILAACFSVMAALASFGSEANTPEPEEITLVEKGEEALPNDTLWVKVQLKPLYEDGAYSYGDLLVKTKYGIYIPDENNKVRIPFSAEDSTHVQVFELGFETPKASVWIHPQAEQEVLILFDNRLFDVGITGQIRVEETEEPVFRRFWPRTDELRNPPPQAEADQE